MSASKDRGTRWETAVVRWLRDHGFPHAERRALSDLAWLLRAAGYGQPLHLDLDRDEGWVG